ncbi:hypothetical protein [Mycobacterium sp. DL99]|uniref:hypothetical protein n=1 Tax=Mycobacterium sp. DL99 TaxID=2528957 RepID=UPI00107FDF12|nr:hypothetical protein [Mycobacterium sp. DL99]
MRQPQGRPAHCTGVKHANFLSTKPYTGPGAWVFFVGYGTSLATLILVAMLTNRRYYRRYLYLADSPQQSGNRIKTPAD